MTIYYIDAVDGDDEGTGAIDDPWQTVAKVNSSSFSGDDHILFKRDCIWREQLTTVPPGGSDGSPITFGAYGSGNNPIITGADLFNSDWSNTGTELDDNFNDNDISDWLISGGVSAGSGRMNIDVATGSDFAYRGFTARAEYWMSCRVNISSISWGDANYIIFNAFESGAFTNTLCLFLYNSGGNIVVYSGYLNDAGAQTGGDGSVLITTGEYHNFLMHYKKSSAPGANNGIAQIWMDGTPVLNLTNVDNDAISDVEIILLGNLVMDGTTGTAAIYIDDFKMGTTPSGLNLYRHAATTEPNFVLFDEVRGTKESSAGLVSSAREWSWLANNLYVYSTSDPASAYTAVESGVRDYGVANAANYVSFDSLQVEKGNLQTFRTTGTNTTVTNCDFRYGGKNISNPLVIAMGNAFSMTDSTVLNPTYQAPALFLYDVTGYTLQRVDVSGHMDAAGIWGSGASTGNMYNCTSHDADLTTSRSVARGGFVLTETGTHNLYNCIAYGNEDGFDTFATAVVNCFGCKSYSNGIAADITSGDAFSAHEGSTLNLYYCVGYGNRKSGVANIETSTGNIYNCTFVNNDVVGWETSWGINISSSGNWNIKNNTIQGHDFEIYIAAGASGTLNIDYNVYNNTLAANAWHWKGTDYNFANWETASSQDAHSLNADPLLDANYRLQAGSPAIDAGTPIAGLHSGSTIVGGDAAGNTQLYGVGVDMGAYEYVVIVPLLMNQYRARRQ